MAGKSVTKKRAVALPKNLDEAAQFIQALGTAERQITQVNAKLNARIDKIKADAMAEIAPLAEQQADLLEGLYVFSEANRTELTEDGKKKTVDLPTGTISWRFTPPAVSLKEVDKVMERIKELGLSQFIRTKEEIDKEAMLKDPETAQTIKGVTIGQKEEFVVKPYQSDAEIKKVKK